MDQPVKMSLDFPRSGQQLNVVVPRHMALQAQSWPNEAVVLIRERDERPACDAGDSKQ